jgi:hypothetical protein
MSALHIHWRGSTVVVDSPRRAVDLINIGRAGPPGPAGPQGPPGPPGVAGGSYTHTQSTPLATWVVNHNLGFNPDVAVRSAGGLEVESEVAHISPNQTEIRFTVPYTGTARFT